MSTPAGWYREPQGPPDQLRYWDGRRWTQFTTKSPESIQVPQYSADATVRLPRQETPQTSQLALGSGNDLDREWRLRHSLWMLAPILGCGALSFVGFVYCAARIRTKAWTAVALSSVLLTFLGYILVSVWTDSKGNPSNAATIYLIDLWLGSIVFAVVINKDYLAWRATRT